MARLALRYADETAHIYENTDAFGPAWIASELHRVPDPEAAWLALVTSDRPLAVVDEGALAGHSWPESSDGVARLRRATARALDVDVEAPAGGVLVVPVHGAGWTARVDGEETTPLRVNGALTGVVVPPGAREVRLASLPATFLLGALLSAVALLALLLWALRVPRDPSG